jgi:RNA polymerase sigma-70 factor (ECF subfamily)
MGIALRGNSLSESLIGFFNRFILRLTHDPTACYSRLFALCAGHVHSACNAAVVAASIPLNTSDPSAGDRGPNQPPLTWAELLALVRSGDAAAAESLVRRLHPLVTRVVQGHCPRGDDPADLVQDVFVKMFCRLEQFDGRAPFEHWVARVAHTTCLDALRRRRARPEYRWSDLSEADQSLLETLAGAAESPDADLPGALELLERLLSQLPPDDAWLLRQVELAERPLAGLCAERGWSTVTGRVRLFRARRRLTAAFKALERASTRKAE